MKLPSGKIYLDTLAEAVRCEDIRQSLSHDASGIP